MTRAKICGIRRVDDALVAAEAGATMLGFVFAPSRRRITPELARDIMAGVRRTYTTQAVGVFVNASVEEMNRTGQLVGLDYVQLSGDEDDHRVRNLALPSIKALHVRPETSSADLAARAAAVSSDFIMLDTAQAGSHGGTGATFDWSCVPQMTKPVLLAGGLTAENVGNAIRTVRPWGVDVSSGVETDGEKDEVKIRLFLARAAAASK